MSRKHFSKNWISPTHGEVTMQEIPKYIREYYSRMKEYGDRHSYYNWYGFAEF